MIGPWRGHPILPSRPLQGYLFFNILFRGFTPFTPGYFCVTAPLYLYRSAVPVELHNTRSRKKPPTRLSTIVESNHHVSSCFVLNTIPPRMS